MDLGTTLLPDTPWAMTQNVAKETGVDVIIFKTSFATDASTR